MNNYSKKEKHRMDLHYTGKGNNPIQDFQKGQEHFFLIDPPKKAETFNCLEQNIKGAQFKCKEHCGECVR